MPVPPPIKRGVVFFSKPMSYTVVGKSGKRYHFTKEQETMPVTNAIDIEYFRSHPNLVEKGKESQQMAEFAQRKGQPKSYTTMRRTVQPPSAEQIQRAEERKARYAQLQAQRANADSAKALAETGVGTLAARKSRELNARVAAGDFEAAREFEDPEKNKAPAKPAVATSPPVPEPEPTPEPAPTPASSAGVLKSECPFCGKKLKNEQGMQMHVRMWCKKNPGSPKYDPSA